MNGSMGGGGISAVYIAMLDFAVATGQVLRTYTRIAWRGLRGKRAIIIAVLAIAAASGETSEVYWKAMDEDFVRTWNKFAEAGNKLMNERKAKWDVKAARELPRLFDRVYNHPLYRK